MNYVWWPWKGPFSMTLTLFSACLIAVEIRLEIYTVTHILKFFIGIGVHGQFLVLEDRFDFVFERNTFQWF